MCLGIFFNQHRMPEHNRGNHSKFSVSALFSEELHLLYCQPQVLQKVLAINRAWQAGRNSATYCHDATETMAWPFKLGWPKDCVAVIRDKFSMFSLLVYAHRTGHQYKPHCFAKNEQHPGSICHKLFTQR